MRNDSTVPTVLRKKLPPNLEEIRKGQYSKNDWDYPIHEYLKENDIKIDETGSDVVEFLKGKSVLVTGATGFLGKFLVEKLLRCCKNIKIFIIVRTKKGKDAETRVKEYLDNWVFIKLSEIQPDFREKVVGISGDFELDGLGLSEKSRKILTQEVNIIFHAAATVRFDEKLNKAVKINIKGTQEIIKLARECKKLDVLTHIGTAYSNCLNKDIKEDFYPAVVDPQAVITITDKMPSNMVEKLTPGLIGDHPNTYSFTKHLAEEVIRTESIGLTTCIQRPAVVVPSVREPIRSWIDNIFGPAGLILGGAMGLLHIMYGNPKGRCEWVPVDYVINHCIVATYKTAKDRSTKKVQIFNYSTSDSNPLYWKNIGINYEQGPKVASTKIISHPFFRFTKCWYWYLFLSFVVQTLPGHIVDFVAVRLGHEPRLTKTYQKLYKFGHLLYYFTLREWSFETTNTKNLWSSLNEKDKVIFAFDMSTLNWRKYFDTYFLGMREFLMFEFLDNLEQGRIHYKRVVILHYTLVSTAVVLSTYYLINTIFCFVPLALISITLFYTLKEDR